MKREVVVVELGQVLVATEGMVLEKAEVGWEEVREEIVVVAELLEEIVEVAE